MSPRRPGSRRLFRLGRLTARDAMRDVDEEMALHLEQRAEQLRAEGVDPETAAEQARHRFAHESATLHALYGAALERNRHMRLREKLESWWHDLRYAARGLARDQLASAFIIVTLALGIGANVTAFSLADRLLLREPPHLRDPARLVRLYGTVARAATGDETSAWIPHAAYRNIRESVTTVGDLGAYRVTERTVGRGIGARKLRVGEALDGFLSSIGAEPMRGRLFAPAEDAATAGPLAVVSERVWRDAFGADPSIVGRALTVDGAAREIIGVVPAGFSGTELRRVDVWLLGDSRTAGSVNWKIVGRLRAGASLAAASAEVSEVHRRASETSPRWFREARVDAGPIRFGDSGREPFEATMARWLAAICAIILLVALGNVTNLLLARLARRRRELALRVALGAARSRVVRLLFLEGTVLAVAAGLLSLVVVRMSEPAITRALLDQDASWSFSLFDGRVMLTLIAVVMLATLFVCAVTALHVGTPRMTSMLRGNSHGGTSASRVRSALTILQAALSVMLLVGAGLFLRSTARVSALDLGVDRDQVLTATLELPQLTSFSDSAFAAYRETELRVFRSAVEAVQRLPGVERAAVAVGLPLDGGSFSAAVHVAGRDSVPVLPGGGPFASAVGSGYFATVGTRLVRGRVFTEEDREGSEPVLIVNETMARALWPDDDALGRCARIGLPDSPCARIVGIVADVHRVGLQERPSMQYYLALGQQRMFSGATLLVRPSPGSPVAAHTLRQAVLGVDPAIAHVETRPLSAALDGEMRPLRLGTVAFGSSSVLALVVAVLGLYSIMAYLVALRTREIGVRAALGATRGQISRLVVTNGITLAAVGVSLGLALAVGAGRWIEPHLFRTTATDPAVLGSVALILLAVAVLAAWIPARRAARISPTEALGSE